jgi:hypothetical protein
MLRLIIVWVGKLECWKWTCCYHKLPSTTFLKCTLVSPFSLFFHSYTVARILTVFTCLITPPLFFQIYKGFWRVRFWLNGLGFPAIVPFGRWSFPLLPRPDQLHIVVGAPLQVGSKLSPLLFSIPFLCSSAKAQCIFCSFSARYCSCDSSF